MAGSYKHCCDDYGDYRGVDLLENMGDMHEAVEEMFFIIRWMADQRRSFMTVTMSDQQFIEAASETYFRCFRGEQPWPEWMGGKGGYK